VELYFCTPRLYGAVLAQLNTGITSLLGAMDPEEELKMFEERREQSK
jgi:hypothetical protein